MLWTETDYGDTYLYIDKEIEEEEEEEEEEEDFWKNARMARNWTQLEQDCKWNNLFLTITWTQDGVLLY